MDAIKATATARWRPAALALLSGVLLTLAFPPLGWWWAAWLALAPWYLTLVARPAAASRRRAPGAGTGLLLGFALFLVGMTWMRELGEGWLMKSIPWVVLSLIQASPFALLGLLCARLLPRLPSPWRPWVFAALWTLFEALRSAGPYAFPWFLLSSTQVRALPLLQIVSLTGQWGLSFFIAAINGLLAEAWLSGRARLPAALPPGPPISPPAPQVWGEETALGEHPLSDKPPLPPPALGGRGGKSGGRGGVSKAWRPLGVAAGVVASLALGGALAMRPVDPDASARRRVALVQGNIAKPEGRSYTDAERLAVLQTYLDLTRQAAWEKPAFVVWPETVVPSPLGLLHEPAMFYPVAALARQTQTPLLVGTIDVDPAARQAFNTAILVDEAGRAAARYDKAQLVPVGEFFPLRGLLGSIYEQYGVPDDDLARGTLPGVFPVGAADTRAANIGAMICYESVFPWIAADRARRGADVLVLLTSDQTFGKTAGPYQHKDLSVVRAVETGRFVARAAATGVSAIIDGQGRITTSLDIGQRGVVGGAITLRTNQTPYVRWGEWFLGVCGLIVVVAVWRRRA